MYVCVCVGNLKEGKYKPNYTTKQLPEVSILRITINL